MRPARHLAALLLPFAVGCGAAEPHYRQRTAVEWASEAWGPSSETSARASKALREFFTTHPVLVTDALAAELVRPRPAPTATPFTIRLDPAAATRLGLERLDGAEALGLDLPLLSRRIHDAGAGTASLHGDSAGDVDVVLDGARSRAEAERLQRFLCRRGALELKAVLEPPEAASPAAGDFTAWFDAEQRRFADAEKAGVAYRPSRADRSVARDASAAGPRDRDPFVAIEEPSRGEDVFTEQMVAQTQVLLDADGRGRVRLTPLPDRRDHLSAWTTKLVGREVAVLRDGVVRERLRVTKPWRDRIDVRPEGELGDPPDELRRAREDAAAIAIGRMPRPLAPAPIPPAFGTDPAPENPVSRLMRDLGPASIPALERVRANALAPDWSKRSAEWALEQIRAFEAQSRKDR